MKDAKRVEIKFEDHYSLGDDWFSKEEHTEIRYLTCIGYLMKEDDNYYYIVSTFDNNTENYQAGTAVLKKCVVDFVEYERADSHSGKDGRRARSRRTS